MPNITKPIPTKGASSPVPDVAPDTPQIHIDDWLDAIHPSTGKDNPGEVYARWWLEMYRWPETKKMLYAEMLSEFSLYCTHGGERWRVTGCSRFGDVWLARDMSRTSGYDRRVVVVECSEWSNTPGEHLPLNYEREAFRALLQVPDQDNEITESPWWVIINPRGLIHTASEIESRLTGPFFSRKAAEDHVRNRRHAFGEKVAIWCLSGYWSYEYKKLLRDLWRRTSALAPLQELVAKWALRHNRTGDPVKQISDELHHLDDRLHHGDKPEVGKCLARILLVLLQLAHYCEIDLGAATRNAQLERDSEEVRKR